MKVLVAGVEYDIGFYETTDPWLGYGYCSTASKRIMTNVHGDADSTLQTNLIIAYLHEKGIDMDAMRCNKEYKDWHKTELPKIIDEVMEKCAV